MIDRSFYNYQPIRISCWPPGSIARAFMLIVVKAASGGEVEIVCPLCCNVFHHSTKSTSSQCPIMLGLANDNDKLLDASKTNG